LESKIKSFISGNTDHRKKQTDRERQIDRQEHKNKLENTKEVNYNSDNIHLLWNFSIGARYSWGLSRDELRLTRKALDTDMSWGLEKELSS